MFPSILNTFNRPATTDRLNSPSHSALHNTVSSALGQVQATIGVEGPNSVIGTMMYDLRSPASPGGGHIQTAVKGGTGLTNYIKGDVLVASSSSVLTKLAIGVDGAVLTADSSQAVGVKWKAGQVTISSFLSSGIWTKPTGISFALVQAWGGGGAGSGGNAGGTGAGAGGGGGYSYAYFPTSLLGTSEAVNIGNGASSVAVGGRAPAGGNTVFGTASLLLAYGGGGGDKVSGASGGGGGGGGQWSAGNTASSLIGGQGGSPTHTSSTIGNDNSAGGGRGGNQFNGDGGNSFFGGGGGGQGGGGTGLAGGNTVFGGGGGGGGGNAGSDFAGGVSLNGGNGGAGSSGTGGNGSVPGGGGGGGGSGKGGQGGKGKVIVTEFY